jgi:oxygen-dependent protoporphyrinogen oxidase
MNQRVAVLGGGISGLSAAWNLARRTPPVEVTVYEAAPRLGGWMETTRTASGGFFELGPRSLRTAGTSSRAAMELVGGNFY